MSSNNLRDKVERWLIHESHVFEFIKKPENAFHVLVQHAGETGVPVEIFEPKNQPGVIVVGSKVVMKNTQIARFLRFNPEEKKRFEQKISEYCYSIQAIFKMIEEDGKQKIGVYVDAIKRVSNMNEKTNKFLLKTF
jgi:hypothetical protein